MATGRGDRQRSERQTRERARIHRARAELRAGQSSRRRRDNVRAALIGGAVILAAIGGQFAYYSAGPGAPEPSDTTSPSPTAPVTQPPAPSATP